MSKESVKSEAKAKFKTRTKKDWDAKVKSFGLDSRIDSIIEHAQDQWAGKIETLRLRLIEGVQVDARNSDGTSKTIEQANAERAEIEAMITEKIESLLDAIACSYTEMDDRTSGKVTRKELR